MAVYLRDRDLLVTAAPGTGSTSLQSLMAAQPGAELVVVPGDAPGGDGKHVTARELLARGWTTGRGRRPTIVTTTRNPFDHLAAEWHRTRTRWRVDLRDPSSWVHHVPGMAGRIDEAVALDFPAWVLRALGSDLSAGRTRHLNPGHVGEADVVLRMEHLDADLRTVCPDLGPVPHENRTPRPAPYWQLYDLPARQAVEAVHRPDLLRFGYAF